MVQFIWPSYLDSLQNMTATTMTGIQLAMKLFSDFNCNRSRTARLNKLLTLFAFRFKFAPKVASYKGCQIGRQMDFCIGLPVFNWHFHDKEPLGRSLARRFAFNIITSSGTSCQCSKPLANYQQCQLKHVSISANANCVRLENICTQLSERPASECADNLWFHLSDSTACNYADSQHGKHTHTHKQAHTHAMYTRCGSW